MSSSNKDSFSFAADIPALANRWSRYLKYVVLDEVYDVVDADSTGKLNFKTALATQEVKARDKARIKQLKALRRILEYPSGYDAFVRELYLNAIACSFDPHTNYFSPRDKEEFQANLSTEAYFFGIIFEENESGQIIVDKLTPGGAAWKSGEINKGDELISLQWEGKEVQDMAGASQEEVYEIIEQATHDKMLFRFRKADGTMSMVFLRKEKTSNDENIVKSFVLNGET